MRGTFAALTATAGLVALVGCGQDPHASGSNAPQTDPASIDATGPNRWGQGQSDAVIKSVDAALMDMVATQIDAMAPTTAPLPINVTASCDQAFASQGSISVLGSYSFPRDPNAPGNFTLTLTHDACPVKTSDGNTAILAGIGTQVAGTLSTTRADDATVTYAFKITALLGDLTLTAGGDDIPCRVDAAGTATYVWNDTMSLTGAYNGNFCAQVMRGQISQSLATTLP